MMNIWSIACTDVDRKKR